MMSITRREDDLEGIIDAVAHLLPAQGPIAAFIHHNPLHAFEHLPFEDAVVAAGERFGCAPFLSEERYRAELAAGRFEERDVAAALEDVHGTVARLDRRTLRLRVACRGIPAARGHGLIWMLRETEVLERFRDDCRPPGHPRALWEACLDRVRRTPAPPVPSPPAPQRHRDLLLATFGIDIDAQIHPVLIRFVGAFLDQGMAHWSLPCRDRGLYGCFLEVHGRFLAKPGWGAHLRRLVEDDHRLGRSAAASLEGSLADLGISTDREAFLADTALALRGWAGMVRQFEERPDRVAEAVPASLRDFLAVRLLLERAALTSAAEAIGFADPLRELRAFLRARRVAAPPPTDEERAWPLFHLAQLMDLDPATVTTWTASEVAALEDELRRFDDTARRRLLHLAYERRLRHRFYDALAPQVVAPAGESDFQAIFCLDEREESLRRHLEEIEPACETFGAAGFFGVAMYYRGAGQAHPRPLCPVAITPRHYVEEEDLASGLSSRLRRTVERSRGLVDKNVHLGSRTLLRGTLVMAVIGVLSLIPLVLRVVFPWLGAARPNGKTSHTRLRLDRTDDEPPSGDHMGFTVEEQAAIVRDVLAPLGILERPAPLVFVIGHGSVSLNNPHESAHDCGACGGNHGGPNARAFAQMANDPRVRRLLADTGLASSWFVGAERNTASNAVTYYDVDRIPDDVRPRFERARATLDRARRSEAQERCRRFDHAPTWFPPRAALLHVEARSADLAQPRPEYGHASNAFCVVGPRAETRGLFFDRRAFLVSYEPAVDPDGSLLARLLAAVVPVVAGINLEYYFGTVDPTGYGCGTKLPHNVTGLLGVMDGAESDLRTGLPWQMVEIHEPVRLTMAVSAPRARLARVVAENAAIARLIDNRWLFLACLDDGVWEYEGGAFHRYEPEPIPVVDGGSSAFFRGHRGHLGFARLRACA